MKPAQIADLLDDANKHEQGEILDQVHGDPEMEADVFEELDPDKAGRLLDDMPDTEVAALLGRMRPDDAADTVTDLRQSRRRVLDLMPAGHCTKVIALLSFNPDSAGGLMNVDIAFCAPEATAAEALAMIAAARALQPEALLKVHVLGDETAKDHGRMPPLTLLEPVTWSAGTKLGMLALRAYLVIGAILLLVKAIQLGRR